MTLKQWLLLFLGIVPTVVQAQSLDVSHIELNDDQVLIRYSLQDTVPGRSFTVNLYSSRDNYVNPLTRLQGDYGMEVTAGNNKTITWFAKQELGEAFQGAVSIEVRARVYVPFIQFDNFNVIKRGKPKEVTWRGGTRQNILNFELYNRKGERVHVIANISNAGHTSLFIPVDVKPGNDYFLRIVDSKNKDQVVKTGSFSIKRKVPLILLAVPTALVGGAIVLLGGGDGEPSTGKEIPDPPGAPN